jgi:hypothetical protein
MINPWVLEQVQAPLFWLSYAVTPGIILLSYRFFTERRLAFGFGTAILWTVASTSPQYTLFSLAIILFVWLVSFLFAKFKGKEFGLSRFEQDLKLWGAMVGIFIVFNIYWIVPIALTLSSGPISPGYTFTAEMLTYFSQNSNLHILTGTDQWSTWWPSANNPVTNFLVIIATVAWLTIFIAAILLSSEREIDSRLFYILSGIWIVGVFFALGWNNDVYKWLATSAPFNSYYGWLLRVPGKISYLLWPAYAVSIGIVGQGVCNYSFSKKNQHSKKFIAVFVILLVASSSYAIIKQQDYFNFYYAPISVPEPYQLAFSYIGQHLNNSDVVADVAPYVNGIQQNDINIGNNFLGLGSKTSYEASYTWNPNRIAGYFVPRSIPVPSIGDYHFTYASTWTTAYGHFGESLSQLNSSSLSTDSSLWFPIYGVNYVLFHDDIYKAIYFDGTNAGDHYLQALNQNFTLVKQWDYVYLYKVPQNFGRVYPLPFDYSESDKPISIDNITTSRTEISNVVELNPTLWTLSVNATSTFKLIFTEGYDANWIATVQAGNETMHVSSQLFYGSINSFAVNQTGLMKVTITYEPQVWLSYGYVFSGIGILLLILSVLYLSRNKIRTALNHLKLLARNDFE